MSNGTKEIKRFGLQTLAYRTCGIDVKWYKRDQEIRALNTGLQDVWHRCLTGRMASMSNGTKEIKRFGLQTLAYRTCGIDVKWYQRDQEIWASNTGLQDVWHRCQMVQKRSRDSGFKHWLTRRVASMSNGTKEIKRFGL
ncbi:hypothetical protein RRG08_052361 [Elysia crispata]|uniref:Uncharacterized protein n=1 Tax=Elysia crispata TaxID=231223 RepID=A0AAE1A8E1_9GAST|nr:hypothetical protein RRG08_052361 [Elysia crispata]